MTSTASPLSSVKMAGHMEDMGLFPGLRGVMGVLHKAWTAYLGKFVGEGGRSNSLVMSGKEKSSI